MKIKMLSIFVVILLVGGFVILNDFKATDSKFSTEDLNVEDLTAEDLILSGPVVPKAEIPIGSITIGTTAHISNVPKTMQVFRVKSGR
jgi:hypothetical protein